MTVLTEGNHSFFITTPAILIDDSIDTASQWAKDHIVKNEAIKWIVGNYVESDNANSNGQYWKFDDLLVAKPTISYSPMNIDHHQNEIVGTWTASEMVYPENGPVLNPYIEVLGAYWRYYFPETLKEVQAGFESGALSISMECVGDSVTCVGDGSCGETFQYLGPDHESYCAHMRDHSSDRQINNPHFLGGALILPGNRPGWKHARVNEISNLINEDEAHEQIKSIAKTFPNADIADWEALMWELQLKKFERIS